LLLSVVFACQQAKPVKSLLPKIDSLFQTIPDFSGVVLLADRGRIIYHKAFGYRRFETRASMDTTDIFELASVSKQFTAMIIMMLAEDHKLDYEDPVARYLPNLPYRNITIRHLLTHTSGLPDYQAVMDQYWDKSKVASNEDNIRYLIQYHPDPLFRPGDEYEYSNTGYMLLATIAEIASGEDFIELCRSRIFSPLEMTQTDFRTPSQKRSIDHFTSGYLHDPERDRYINADSFPAFNYTIWLGNRKGPGRISSTARDLFTWDRALYTEKLVHTYSMREAYSPMNLADGTLSYYGFGWVISSDSLWGDVVSHTGDNPGYKTEIVRYIDADKTIILLNNNAHEKKSEIIKGLRAILSGNRRHDH
jgi:CubicO group peptidase (beta-lactamase class C family)